MNMGSPQRLNDQLQTLQTQFSSVKSKMERNPNNVDTNAVNELIRSLEATNQTLQNPKEFKISLNPEITKNLLLTLKSFQSQTSKTTQEKVGSMLATLSNQCRTLEINLEAYTEKTLKDSRGKKVSDVQNDSLT